MDTTLIAVDLAKDVFELACEKRGHEKRGRKAGTDLFCRHSLESTEK